MPPEDRNQTAEEILRKNDLLAGYGKSDGSIGEEEYIGNMVTPNMLAEVMKSFAQTETIKLLKWMKSHNIYWDTKKKRYNLHNHQIIESIEGLYELYCEWCHKDWKPCEQK